MDPVTLIGTAGAAANILQAINSAISSLNQLHSQWKDADFTFMNLAAQLGALRIALGKLQEWMQSENEDSQHHQLIMDLDMSLTCCHLLVQKMDAHLMELRQMPNGNLRSASKVKLILADSSIERLQQMVERQTNALTLVLSACNCATASQQKAKLEEPDARNVFEQVRDDSSSLIGLRDSSSFISRYTDRLSKLSVIFPFDKEVLNSSVYQRVLRGSLKEKIRQQQTREKATRHDKPKENWREDRMRNEQIEKQLRRDRMAERNRIPILFTGHQRTVEDIISRILDVCDDRPSITECAKWRNQVILQSPAVLRTWYETSLESGALFECEPSFESEARLKTWKDAAGPIYDSMEQINFILDNHSISTLLLPFKHPLMRETIRSKSSDGVDDRDNILGNLQALAYAVDLNYTPSRKQIADLGKKTNRVHEYDFFIGELTYRLIEVPQSFTQGGIKSRGPLAFWNSATALVYVVDLNTATSISSLENDAGSAFKEALATFDRLLRQGNLNKTPIILIFSVGESFKARLREPHFEDCLPGYRGGSNCEAALDFILTAFISYVQQLSDARLLHSHFLDGREPDISKFIISAVNDIIIQANLAEFNNLFSESSDS